MEPKYTLIIFKLELKSIQNLKSTNYIKMEKFKIVLKHKWYPNIFGITTLFSTVLFLYESKGNIDIIILISSAALFQFILRLPTDRSYADPYEVNWTSYDYLIAPNICDWSENEKINKYWKLSYKIIVYLVLNIILVYAVCNPNLEPQETAISVFKGALLFLLGYLIFLLFLFFKEFVLKTIIND